MVQDLLLPEAKQNNTVNIILLSLMMPEVVTSLCLVVKVALLEPSAEYTFCVQKLPSSGLGMNGISVLEALASQWPFYVAKLDLNGEMF